MRRLAGCLAALIAASLPVAAAAPALQVERVERGNLITEGIPEIPERISESLNPYQSIRSASLEGWHPSGDGILITTRFAETDQVHHVAFPGGARRQITFFEEPIASAAVGPDGGTGGFIFGKDVGGSEFYQLYFYELATGDHILLTDGRSRNGSVVWSNAGRRYAHYTTRRNGRDWDIHIGDIDRPGFSRPMLETGGSWTPLDWSPDDSRILLMRYVSINESSLHILDVATGALRDVRPGGETIAYGGALFSGDGKGLYYTSDEDSEFRQLRYIDLGTEESAALSASIPWDVEEFTLSRTGRHLAFTTNEDGIARLRVLDLNTMSEVTVPEIPIGQIRGLHFSPDGRRLGMTLDSSQTPGDVYSIDLESRELVRWTESEAGGLQTDQFVIPELIRFRTFDTAGGVHRTIPAFYYRPPGGGRFPVIISIHGGPEGQARPSFSATVQQWVNELGIAVLRPNVRGSEGYGKTYLKLDNGFAREDSVKDIGALIDWVATRPELDADRIAVEGGSYGGYMVLASMAMHKDRIKAGIERVGISNFVTFLENTQDYRRDLRRAEYGDERDPEMRSFLERISPTSYAGKIDRPMFIAQGLNDPRVPASESEQIVRAIRDGGGSAWYMLARDEGHGFRKRVNRDAYEAAANLFLETFLLE